MYNEKVIEQVKCDVCGKKIENFSWRSKKEEGWQAVEDNGNASGKAHVCPNCLPEAITERQVFQKPDDKIHGVIKPNDIDGKMTEEWEGPDMYQGIDFHNRLTGRAYEVVGMNMDNATSRFVEVERKSDGEKFWHQP